MEPFTSLPGFPQLIALEQEIALSSEPQQSELLCRYARLLHTTLYTCHQQRLSAEADQLILRCTRRFPGSVVLQEAVIAFYTETGQPERATRLLSGGVTLQTDADIRSRTNRMTGRRPLLAWRASVLTILLALGAIFTVRPLLTQTPRPTIGSSTRRIPLSANAALQQATVAYHQRAAYREALQWTEIALVGYRASGDSGSVASALIQKGEALNALADFAGARLCYQEALGIRTLLGQKLCVAALQEDLADLCTILGDYTEASSLLWACLATRAEAKEENGVAQAQRGLGTVAAAQKRYREALAFYRQAMQYAVAHHNAALAADLKLRIAAVYRDTGAFASATACAEESLRFWRRQTPPNARWLAVAEQTLGSIDGCSGATQKAEAHLRRSDALLEGIDASYTRARTRVWLARVLRAKGSFDEANRLAAVAYARVPLSPSLLER